VLVNYRRLGTPDADVLRAYPGLTPADLEAAWAYAAANTEEIDRAIRENEEGAEGLVE
jgi:type III restriction enzyme